MDNPSNWTTTDLFSPSKARAQQAQAKDWAAVDAWLTKKYAPARRPPIFERNEETLEALLTLATLNEAADEQRALVDRVQKAALQAFRNAVVEGGRSQADLRDFFRAMEGDEGLATLAKTVVALDVSDARTETLASAVADLTAQKFAAEQLIERADDQLRGLRAERSKADQQLRELKDGAFRPAEGLPEQTTEWVRSAKQLRAKIGEYDERLAAMNATPAPRVKIEDVKRQSDELAAQQSQLKDLEVQMEAFQSLPTDAKAARAKLESAREELRKLTKERDGLFEQLVDDG